MPIARGLVTSFRDLPDRLGEQRAEPAAVAYCLDLRRRNEIRWLAAPSDIPNHAQMPVAAELEKLRALHRQAREQRESIWRGRMLADALLAVRDPNAALN